MSHFALVLEQSRKAKAARHVYDYLRGKVRDKSQLLSEIIIDDTRGTDGIHVEPGDKYRILNVRIHDEHMSPYFRTNLNLFQLLMIDEHSDMSVYRSENGWLFVFEGLAPGPLPFGQNGFDTR
ncbi:hypothetical protein [Alicyclobacillus dauci]|uniref:Uncharacterized protein n=1 Tax=Alicyclobacillus dauci TaxID=1475485 RepID=A0ABY6Z9Z6_9BACL|nr:hypothetical protein [Alicyclobacillus dauci]WAH39081.1 hypothetical protein NZD86_11670 [Alicyclobacillus dauci]